MACPIEEHEDEDEDEDELIYRIEDELGQPLTDPIKESTVDYYLKNKDTVSSVRC